MEGFESLPDRLQSKPGGGILPAGVARHASGFEVSLSLAPPNLNLWSQGSTSTGLYLRRHGLKDVTNGRHGPAYMNARTASNMSRPMRHSGRFWRTMRNISFRRCFLGVSSTVRKSRAAWLRMRG